MVDNERLEQIDLELKTNQSSLITDGITDIGQYIKTTPKILWILKEPNDKDHASCDLKAFHRNIFSYPKWRRTYSLIIKVSYGIINSINEYDEIPEESTITSVLRHIAHINVKKIGASSRTDPYSLNKYYNENKTPLLDQIKCIDPNIIINCSRVYSLFKDITDTNHSRYNSFNYSKSQGKIVINAYHPNCRYSHRKYFDNIITIVNDRKI